MTTPYCVIRQVNLVHKSQHRRRGERRGERWSAGQAYDIVLLDLEMPILDGFRHPRAIRANPGQGLAVIFQTGREDVEAIDRAFASARLLRDHQHAEWRLLTYQILMSSRFRAERMSADGSARDRAGVRSSGAF